MDDDDEFYDTTSLTSSYSVGIKRKSNNKDYISLSRNTVYHSAIDLDMELDTLDARRSPLNKVDKYPVTYSQWKDRVLFFWKCKIGHQEH